LYFGADFGAKSLEVVVLIKLAAAVAGEKGRERSTPVIADSEMPRGLEFVQVPGHACEVVRVLIKLTQEEQPSF